MIAISPANLPFARAFAISAVAVATPNDTLENTVVSITIPGGTLGPNDGIRITVNSSANNNANAKTLRTRLGGTTFSSVNLANNVTNHNLRIIQNRGAVNSQVGQNMSTGSGLGSSTGANVTASVDMSVNQTLEITCQKAVGTDTVTVEAYVIEILKP